MSAALRASTVAGGLAVFGAAAAYTLKTSTTDFSKVALASAEHGVPEAISPAAMKPKLPSNFFQFTLGNYKISNARV